MAQTKVKLISDGVIDVNHLSSGHSITTDNIGEGSNLYYTDARVSTYLSTNSYATEGYVTTAVSNLVAAAPSTLDTLNELAAALGDDPNFATTVTNSIATKLPLAGGTLTGNLNLQTSDDTRLSLSDTTDSSSITVRADLTNSIYSNKSLNIYTENADHISFSTNGQSSERVRIDSSGHVTIGDISSAPTGTVPLTIFRSGSNANLAIQSGGGSGRKYELISNTAGDFIVYDVNGSTEKLNILAGGNIGINVTSPATKLHVGSTGTNSYSSTITKGSNMKGIMTTLSNNADDMVGIYFATGSTTEGTHWSGITGSRSNSASHWGTQLNFYTHDNDVANINNATQKMVIKGDGNVGIGTTSPSQKLHVNGNTYSSKYLLPDGGDVAWNGGWSSGNPTIAANGDEFRMYAAGNGSSNILYLSDTRLAYGGNLGIATTNPTGKLQVNNTGTQILRYTTSANLEVYEPEGQTGYVRLGAAYLKKGVYSSSDLNLWAEGDNPIVFYAGGGGTTSERMRITSGGTAILTGAIPFNFTNTGTGTYNKTVIYNDQSNGLLIEGAIATDSYSGTKLPVTLTWRGGIGQGGLKLNGSTQLFTDDTGLGIGNSSPSAKLTVSAGGTNEFAESIWGNYNSQGSAARHTIVRHYPVVSSGTRLEFPFISQGNLNCTTIVKVWGHGARWNTKNHTAFTATFAVGHLLSLGYLQLLESSGNVSSLTSSGMTVYLNFTADYTSATANGVYVTIEYMTSVRSYSLDTANITMN